MNVLVIGGNGLFGRKTVVHLLRDEEVSLVVSMDGGGDGHDEPGCDRTLRHPVLAGY